MENRSKEQIKKENKNKNRDNNKPQILDKKLEGPDRPST